MEKRLFLAFSITLVFFMVYSHVVKKFVPQPVAVKEDSRQQTKEVGFDVLPSGVSQEVVSLDIEEKEENIDLPQASVGNFIVTYSPAGGYIKKLAIGEEEYELPFQNIGFLPEDKEKEFTFNLKRNAIEFKGPQGEKKEFVFKDYVLQIKLDPPPVSPIVLFSNYLSAKVLDQRYQEIFYSQGQKLKRVSPRKIKDSDLSNIKFAGARDRYYAVSLLEGDYGLKWVNSDKKKSHLYLMAPSKETFLYIGPQIEKELKPFGLQGIMYYGFFHGIAVWMIKLLYLLHGIVGNWGLSIVLFSISVSLVLFPFTSKSSKAMRKMQQIQPEVEELKTKYKDNPQKIQKETIELYRKYKINPLGGCLPLFFQIPVIMAFYQVVYRFIEFRGASFLWIKDLAAPDRFLSLPFPAPVNYLNLLPLLLMAMGIAQQKITTSSSTGSSQQKSMGLFFAVFIGIIFYGFPAALTIYWLVQNVFTLSYQVRLSKAQN
ncbi:MAG: membrane protein insertase YidC [Candidatus Omnitrophica bacterium]|nr:membrane protein insertase YidC [Candidatus Omnitrophota bacterium]